MRLELTAQVYQEGAGWKRWNGSIDFPGSIADQWEIEQATLAEILRTVGGKAHYVDAAFAFLPDDQIPQGGAS